MVSQVSVHPFPRLNLTLTEKSKQIEATCSHCGASRTFLSWSDPTPDQHVFCFNCHQEFFYVAGLDSPDSNSNLSKS